MSLYAATKKSNEIMAFTYSHLYGIPATGLRFFTVYGPFGRPDMAYFKFTKAILSGQEIEVYNNGEMMRDFTYIDDVVKAILAITKKLPQPFSEKGSLVSPRYALYNIGNSSPVSLQEFISTIEEACGEKANIKFLPMQQGDVRDTFADVEPLSVDFGFRPSTLLSDGIAAFVSWYRAFYKV